MAAPQCDSVAIENGGDDFIETPKVVNKVEAEPRPDFKELKSIEKERREILLRVSAYDMQSCVSAFVDMHIFFSNQFHSFPLNTYDMLCYPFVYLANNQNLSDLNFRRNFHFGESFFSGLEHASRKLRRTL